MTDKAAMPRDPVEIGTSELVTATGGNRVELAMQAGTMFGDFVTRGAIYSWGEFAKLNPFLAPYVHAVEKATDATGHSPAIRKLF